MFLIGQRQSGPIKSVLLVIIGWLVGWLVRNAIFSDTALSIFLIFCMKLGDYKDRKVTEPDFCKTFLIWRYSQRSPNQLKIRHFDIFLENGFNNFFGFSPEVSTKSIFPKICNLEIFDLEIVKKLPKLRFLVIFLTLHHQFSLILHIMIGGHDVQLLSYNSPVQSMYSCSFYDQ